MSPVCWREIDSISPQLQALNRQLFTNLVEARDAEVLALQEVVAGAADVLPGADRVADADLRQATVGPLIGEDGVGERGQRRAGLDLDGLPGLQPDGLAVARADLADPALRGPLAAPVTDGRRRADGTGGTTA